MRELRLEEQIDRTHQNPDQESKLALTVGRIVDWLRNGSASWAPDQDEIFRQLQEISGSYKIAEPLEYLALWELENNYEDGASEALPLLKELAEEALDNEWHNLGLYLYVVHAELSRELGADDELHSAASVLFQEFMKRWDNISPNTRGEVLDSTGYLLSGLCSGSKSEVESQLDNISAEAHRNREFEFERNCIDTLLSVAVFDSVSREDLQGRLVESFEMQYDVQSHDPTQEAHLLQEALSRCAEFLDFSQKNEWKVALRQAHRDSIDNMAELSHEPSDTEIDELNEGIEEILDNAERVAEEENQLSAVYYLLAVPYFVPEATREVNDERGASVFEIFPRVKLTQEGDAIPESDESQRHHQYGVAVQFRNNLLTTVLKRAFGRRIISEGSLYLYLETIDGITIDDISYLTDMIIAHFDGRYAEAVHLGVARLEGVISSMLQSEGIETASLKEEYMTPTPLPGLLNILEEQGVNKDLVEYLRYRYSDISGQQIRNKVAHGRVGYRFAAWNLSLILLFDILVTVGWLDEELRYRAD